MYPNGTRKQNSASKKNFHVSMEGSMNASRPLEPVFDGAGLKRLLAKIIDMTSMPK